ISVSILAPPVIGLGADTALCEGDTLLLEAPAGLQVVAWQDGSTGPSFSVAAAGDYALQVIDSEGCIGTDTIEVNLLPSASFSLGPDTILCAGSSLELSAPAGYDVVAWQDGSTGSSILATAEGAYALLAANSAGCLASDTIGVAYSDLFGLWLEPAPVTCYGDSTGVLEAFPSGGLAPFSYSWDAGDFGAIAMGLPAGAYSATVSDAAGCTQSAVAVIAQPEGPIMTTDTLRRCAGAPFIWEGEPVFADTLLEGLYSSITGCDSLYQLHVYFSDTVRSSVQADICAGDIYNWEGLSFDRDTSVCLMFSTVAGCDSLSCLELRAAPPIMVDAGADQQVEAGAAVVLSGSSSAAMVQWLPEMGLSCPTCLSTIAELMSAQIYQLVATDSLGCTAMDEVSITLLPSSNYYLPNAFSPNSDGSNDTFGPLTGHTGMEAAAFRVYNRWGGLVFERSNLPLENASLHWDGVIKGELAPAGVYVWTLQVLLPDGRAEQVQGEVLLLR
ncbi:MAG: gliding motility-associated C-terminal domain-containing protein, partial [Phaeodactylibacter sp.]|nr:gliding motility-associated C-terminal domain-containing protein [Phaeodactylibacter sp.]